MEREPIKKRKSIPAIVGAALILLIVFALFGLSVPYAVTLAKDVRTWGLSEIPALLDTFEEDYNEAFPRRNDFINLNGLLARALQKRELNEVYLLKNGQLASRSDTVRDMRPLAESLSRLSVFLDKQGIPMVYVQIPSKETMIDTVMPEGLSDYSRDKVERLLALLRQENVNTLHLAEKMEADGYTQDEAYLRTDHHWRPETAFYASGKIMEHLNKTLAIDYDPALCDLANYHVDTYENWLLGSRGKRTGALFAGTDDFSVIHPKFDTQMSTDFSFGTPVREGSYYDVNIDTTRLFPKDYFGTIAYCTYIGGDYPIVIHKNPSAPTKKRVLMLKDSFALPLQAFLSLHVTELDVLDPRYYDDIMEYIEQTRPDVVLVCYNTVALSTPQSQFFSFMPQAAD